MTTQSAAGESNATEGAAVQRAVGVAAGVPFFLFTRLALRAVTRRCRARANEWGGSTRFSQAAKILVYMTKRGE
jgi:hypothetical protein